jgi:hypothetical protein
VLTVDAAAPEPGNDIAGGGPGSEIFIAEMRPDASGRWVELRTD